MSPTTLPPPDDAASKKLNYPPKKSNLEVNTTNMKGSYSH